MTAIKKECRSGVEDKWPVVDENCNSNKAAVYRNNNTQNNGALVKYVSVHSERIHETVQSYFCCTSPPSRPNIATLYIYTRNRRNRFNRQIATFIVVNCTTSPPPFSLV